MLPIKTSSQDAIALVDYLKTKATGVTIADARAAVDTRLLDERKLKAYEDWGFINRDSGRLKLTEFGWKVARAGAEQRVALLGHVLRAARAYRIALEWIFHSQLNPVTTAELAAHWHQHLNDEVGSNENSIREQVNCFFQLSEGAGLGRYIVGRTGAQTRFEPNRDAIGQLVAEIGLSGEDADDRESTSSEEPADIGSGGTVAPLLPSPATTTQSPPAPEALSSAGTGLADGVTKVFISHGKNIDIVEQVKTMLDLANLPYEVVVEEESTAIPVPEKVFSAMRRCTAAVICVTADPDMRREDGSYTVNQNVLIEIGAAFVLYEKRLVLVWDRRITIPSNLQGLYRCEFEGEELTWTAGMKLMKAVSQFRRPSTAG